MFPRGSLELHIPQLCCLVCNLWAAVAGIAHGRDRIAAAWTANKVLEKLGFFGEAKRRKSELEQEVWSFLGHRCQ